MSNHLNLLYADYLKNDAIIPLLQAVRTHAMNLSDDEDVAQSVVIEVWQELPRLEIKASFSAWLSNKIKWRNADAQRRRAADSLTQVPTWHPSDGEPQNDADALDALIQEYKDSDLAVDLDAITNPFVRAIAELLLQDMTQAEIAEHLKLTPTALRQRLFRYRETLTA